MKCDAFIALPGGYGTLEELLEMITWCQLGIHSKPIGILNINGYYDHLIELFKNSVKEGFISKNYENIYVSATNVKDLMDKMENFVPVEGIIPIWSVKKDTLEMA